MSVAEQPFLPETIVAAATAPGRAAIAVIRVSGPAALAVAAALVHPVPPPRQAALRVFRTPDGTVLDHGLVLVFRAPASQTGEDCVEFQCHGGPAVVAVLLKAVASQPGCRLARPGEFTRRAFLNGKLDLAAVEALGDLVEAETEAQRQQALQAATLGETVEHWRVGLIEGLALLAAEIDFADEGEAPTETRAAALAAVRPVAAALRERLAAAGRAEIVRDGFTVVIAGPPNAGKSTLLNRLAGREAALVSATAGTTRDLIEVRLDVDGMLIVLVDTAGLRDSADPIEQAGIARARVRAAEADLVVWLVPPEGAEAPPPARDVLPVATKADLQEAPLGLAISAPTGLGLSALLDTIAARARAAAGPLESRLMTRARHHDALQRASEILDEVLIDASRPIEIMVDDLQAAANALGGIVGRIDAEALLDDIFSRFCLGK